MTWNAEVIWLQKTNRRLQEFYVVGQLHWGVLRLLS